jgi:hypothetical protein
MSERHISEAKGFQRATAEAALETFAHNEGPRRYLVADEVGLGKTVVARTIIGEMMRRRRTPLVVFYVSSNLNIAHQNRSKLLELLETEAQQKQASAKADRLTLAANPAYRPKHERLQLYTLTPDTSVPMRRGRGGFGRMEERALIFRLLRGRFPSLDTKFFSAQCRGKQASEANWQLALQRHEHIDGVCELQNHLLDALGKDKHLKLPCVDADSILTAAERKKPSQLMGSLRTALAVAVLRDIRPDLVIFDEFQKFREVLIDPPKVFPDPVTVALRGGNSAHSHAVLLLSATPYRLYSSRQDEAAGLSHHREFFELIRFLFDAGTNELKDLEDAFLDFGAKMLARETPDFELLHKLREDIRSRLRPVLSRTERPNDTASPFNASPSHPHSEVRPEDLRLFKHWVGRLQEGATVRRAKVDILSFAVPFWLSVPLPIQMLGKDYVAWRDAAKEKRRREEPMLRRTQRDRLEGPKVWPHPQFRVLNDKIVPSSRLALPWVAPSLPWWDLQGPWSEPGAAGGKLLIFSRFKAVPPALASLLSFDLEASFASRLPRSYKRTGEARPLQFKEDRPTLPALFFPSPTLIAFTDPRRDRPSSLGEVRTSMRRQIGQLLRRLGIKVQKRGPKRLLWKLLPALEHAREKAMPDSGLPSWTELRSHLRKAASGQEEAMKEVLAKWQKYAEAGLEFVTSGEVAELAEFALSGPGVVLGRALLRHDSDCITNEKFGPLLDASWNGLRSYLDFSVFKAALTRRGQTYTKAIPEAVIAGNLESVLDEHLWIASKLDADSITRFPRDLLKTLGLYEGRHRLHEPGTADGFLLRCHAAMPFADAKVENALTGADDRLRTDDMRRSFNTPFWPHVLVTTSLGQEGLDFHVWCRQLLHWDLCPSPLDLEQREGRIQRFGGLSVRSALAESLRQQTLAEAGDKTSPWAVLANHAERAFDGDASGLSPWWSCPGEKLDRLFVVLPQSQQTNRFNQLSRLRWLYRLALGQPHQQDFIETVSQLPDDGRQNFALCLSAFGNGRE